MNAYLATRVAAQATPARDLEPTVAALATWSSYLATRGPARPTLAPDATFTPAPGGPTLTVSPPPPTPAEGSPPTPFCRPAEASVELSASPTRLEIGQTVSVTVTLANGHGSEAKLGLIRYTLEVRPAGALTSDEPGPVEHPITLEPGRSDEAAFVLRAAAPGRATLTGSASYEMHALDYSWGSWSGCGSRPLEIVVGPVTEAE